MWAASVCLEEATMPSKGSNQDLMRGFQYLTSPTKIQTSVAFCVRVASSSGFWLALEVVYDLDCSKSDRKTVLYFLKQTQFHTVYPLHVVPCLPETLLSGFYFLGIGRSCPSHGLPCVRATQ